MAKKATSKIKKPNTKFQEPTKRWFDEYDDLLTLRIQPIAEVFVERLTLDLVDQALNDDRFIVLSSFFQKRGISSDTIKRWKDKHRLFKEGYEFAKQIIGRKREEGALFGTLDSGMVRSSMSIYCKDWKDMEEWRSQLRDRLENKKQNITVMIDGYPSSPLVPEKK